MSEAPENEIVKPEDYGAGAELPLPDHGPNGELAPSEPLEAWTALPVAGVGDSFSAEVGEERERAAPDTSQPLFQSWFEPEFVPQPRIPHLGHVLLLCALVFVGLACTSLLTQSALHFHLFGISTFKQAVTDIHYTLGSMASIYLFTLLAALLIFPLFWHKGFLRGIQWRGTTALRLHRQLFSAAFACFLLAMLNSWLLPGPTDTPIDKMFRTQAAAWLMFGFGVTFAPLFEEIAFRGFLLPAVCTALDWFRERDHHEPAPPLDMNGHPEWSIVSMIAGSVLVSIPFAWMHAEQTGYSLGPFLLLVCVSLVLCWVRLSTRSLAASIIVHSCYNFLLFSLMLLGTAGFRHLERM